MSTWRALTVCQPYQTIESLAFDGFGYWLAGFADGEGCFYLTRSTQGSHRCQFRIKLRWDDKPILEEIARRTGLGYVVDVKGSSGPMAEWMVVRKADCQQLVRVFRSFPLRAKKARDFNVWEEAVSVLALVRHVTDGRELRAGGGSMRDPRQQHLARLRERLQEIRRAA